MRVPLFVTADTLPSHVVLQFVSELIDPSSHPSRSNPKLFLYEIVANARTSLDVDKFDYLARDCHNIGMSTNLRHDRLVKNCRVIDNQLCYNSKEVYNVGATSTHTRHMQCTSLHLTCTSTHP